MVRIVEVPVVSTKRDVFTTESSCGYRSHLIFCVCYCDMWLKFGLIVWVYTHLLSAWGASL